MKSAFATLSLLSSLPLLLAQSTSGITSATSGTSTAAAASAAGTAVSLTFSLISTDAQALPLSSIVANVPSAASSALATTYTSNTAVPSAPSMPDVSTIKPTDYPTLDKTPPTDSDEVKQWLQEVQDSGISIPDYSATTGGGACASNTEAAADKDRCWWTCTGCVRDTDITTCLDKNTWGLTYDDGPSVYTPQLLNYLEDHDLRATFFAVGSRVVTYAQTLQQEYLAGHQVGVHTWSHAMLTTLTNEQIVAELGWTRKVIKDALGVSPNTMRPPYGDIDDRVRAISLALGMTPVMWTRTSAGTTFDTADFDVHGGLTTSEQVLNNWDAIINNASQLDTGFIVLEHDLFQQTVELATGYLLPDAMARKLTIEPVITCQHKSLSAAYIETNTTNSSSSTSSGDDDGNSNAASRSRGSNDWAFLSLFIAALLGAHYATQSFI